MSRAYLLDDAAEPDRLRLVVVGQVDHGKSTLVGRLLHAADALTDERRASIEASRQADGSVEWSLAVDGSAGGQAQHRHGAPDSAEAGFQLGLRRVLLIDAPGHQRLLPHMISGAAPADAALLLVAADEGITEQTRRHLNLLRILGVRRVLATINKMDLADWSAERFHQLVVELRQVLATLGLSLIGTVPISARHGEGIAAPPAPAPWYRGPNLMAFLRTLSPAKAPVERPLRFAVQDVLTQGVARTVLGRVEEGRLFRGQRLRFFPGNETASITRIRRADHDDAAEAGAGEAIGLELTPDIFVARGHAARAGDDTIGAVSEAEVRLFWLAEEPLGPGRRLTVSLLGAERGASLVRLLSVTDLGDLSETEADTVPRGGLARALIRFDRPLLLDESERGTSFARAVLLDGKRVVGGFVVERRIETKPAASTRSAHTATVWFTGPSSADNARLARQVQAQLRALGRPAAVLDGEEIHAGFSADLGFSAEDQGRHTRRAAHLAKILASQGIIPLVALLVPHAAQRAEARRIVGAPFHLIFVDADPATSQPRAPKDRAALAANDPLHDHGSAYEAPSDSALRIVGAQIGSDEAAETVVNLLVEPAGDTI